VRASNQLREREKRILSNRSSGGGGEGEGNKFEGEEEEKRSGEGGRTNRRGVKKRDKTKNNWKGGDDGFFVTRKRKNLQGKREEKEPFLLRRKGEKSIPKSWITSVFRSMQKKGGREGFEKRLRKEAHFRHIQKGKEF